MNRPRSHFLQRLLKTSLICVLYERRADLIHTELLADWNINFGCQKSRRLRVHQEGSGIILRDALAFESREIAVMHHFCPCFIENTVWVWIVIQSHYQSLICLCILSPEGWEHPWRSTALGCAHVWAPSVHDPRLRPEERNTVSPRGTNCVDLAWSGYITEINLECHGCIGLTFLLPRDPVQDLSFFLKRSLFNSQPLGVSLMHNDISHLD